MSCRFPPPLSDDTLFDAIEGHTSNEVLAHIEQCDYCAERLQQVRHFMGAFEVILPRIDCPSPQKIVEYALSASPDMPMLLSEVEHKEIQVHLRECALCSDELARWKRSELLLNEPPQVKATAQRKVTARPHQRLTVSINYRGGKGTDEYFLDLKVENITLFIELRRDTGHWLLTGQLIDDEPLNNWAGAVIELWQMDNLIAIEKLDDNTEFKFSLRTLQPIDLHIHAVNQNPLVLEGIVLNKSST